MRYPQSLLEHYRAPRYRYRLAAPDASVHLVNPLCGDEVTFDVRISHDGVEAGFEAVGCAICIGSADLAASAVREDKDGLAGLALEAVPSRLGIDLPPGRLRCATIGWDALQRALRKAKDR